MSSQRRLGPWFALVAIFAITIVVQFVYVEPGPLTVDEVTYHRMTDELVSGGGFFIHNGYEDIPSEELATQLARPTAGGKLASQYPYGSPALNAPLYVLFGFRGAFLLNALALAIAVMLCHRIAWQLLRDRFIAIASSALLATTYFTEYGMASWPHMTALASILAAFSLGLSGHQAHGESPRRALGLYLASGVCMGLGASLRLDSVLCAPAIAAPLLFAAPTRVRAMIAFGIGLVPGMLFIVVTNYIRWGGLSPMSYGPTGHSAADHLPFLVALVCVTAALWFATRPRALRWTGRHIRGVVAAVLLSALAVMLLRPHAQRDLLEMMSSLHAIVAYVTDLRMRPNYFPLPGESAAIIYVGALKKALLQSVPFFVLVIVPILRSLRERELRATVAWLLVIPVSVTGFFGVFVWHGGMCIHLRYLLSALPFLCILSAFALRDLIAQAPRGWWIAAGLPLVPAFAVYVTMHDTSSPFVVPAQETLVLTAPLVIGLALLGSLVLWHVTRKPYTTLLALALTGTAVGWTLGVSVEDARWSQQRRSRNHEVSECVAAAIPDHSLIIAEAPDANYGVASRRRDVRIAAPIFDNFETTRELLSTQLAHGQHAYVVAGPLMWKLLRWHGVLDGYGVDVIESVSHFVLGEIRSARPGEQSSGLMTDIKGWTKNCGPYHPMWSFQFDPRLGSALFRTPATPSSFH